MFKYRAFRNTDPPQLCRLWHSAAVATQGFHDLTPAVFDEQVLSKPFFDREGLIVAERNGDIVAFVHAGFGPAADRMQLDLRHGIICLLMIGPDADASTVGAALIERGEQYLRARGATRIQAGVASPKAPFYQGLLGGCLAVGIPADDQPLCQVMRSAGYAESERRTVVKCSVEAARPVVNRTSMQVRRECQVQVMLDPPSESWWEACTDAWQPRFRFLARGRRDGHERAHLTYVSAVATGQSARHFAMGLRQIKVVTTDCVEGILLFLLGESIRQLRTEGVEQVEALAGTDSIVPVSVFEQLGFQPAADGIVFIKSP